MTFVFLLYLSRSGYSKDGVEQRPAAAHADAGATGSHGAANSGRERDLNTRDLITATTGYGWCSSNGRILRMYPHFLCLFNTGLPSLCCIVYSILCIILSLGKLFLRLGFPLSNSANFYSFFGGDEM